MGERSEVLATKCQSAPRNISEERRAQLLGGSLKSVSVDSCCFTRRNI